VQASAAGQGLSVGQHQLTPSAQQTLAAGGGLGALVVKHLLKVIYAPLVQYSLHVSPVLVTT
jgi:hypothetical protein